MAGISKFSGPIDGAITQTAIDELDALQHLVIAEQVMHGLLPPERVKQLADTINKGRAARGDKPYDIQVNPLVDIRVRQRTRKRCEERVRRSPKDKVRMAVQ